MISASARFHAMIDIMISWDAVPNRSVFRVPISLALKVKICLIYPLAFDCRRHADLSYTMRKTEIVSPSGPIRIDGIPVAYSSRQGV